MRKSQGLTQEDFAKIFNYSGKTVSKWELGYAIPSVETLKQIADYYGVTVDYFLISHDEIIDTKKRYISRKSRRIMIIALFDLFFLLICATIYAAMATGGGSNFWPIFIWGIMASSLFNAIATNAWFKHSWTPYLFVSMTIWTALIGVYITIWNETGQYSFWYLFFVGLPVQIGAIIILSLSHSSTRD